MENIEALVGRDLVDLEIDHCKKAFSEDVISSLQCLSWLRLIGCGKIKSLGFVRKMRSLQRISFVGTEIVDGDMSYLIGLEYAGFIYKCGYSHTFEEIKAMAGKGSGE